jgi:hypothetical protein
MANQGSNIVLFIQELLSAIFETLERLAADFNLLPTGVANTLL